MRNGDFEVEFQGGWSERKIRQTFNLFRQLTKDLDEGAVQIIEGGRVIDRTAPAYKLKPADIERARELQRKKP